MKSYFLLRNLNSQPIIRHWVITAIVISFTSCIPLSLAPDFQKEGYKLKEAKRFKRELPKQHAFIFVDPKEADVFYNFINTKFELYDLDVDYEVPFRIENELYYLSFFEVEKSTTTLNIFPMMIDAVADGVTELEDEYVWDYGTWYIAITVMDNDSKDCLKESHPKHTVVLQYLKNLKQEYVDTQNSEESLPTKKS
ncbi:hypothetical protein [Winogradskyella sp.]|uniref:hypothetical protein n=1 Tax=Winogradskyella sp. TaxID=1883156 RepID=UPI00260AC421|nr:hypothetical protein [Winogradskyella sp.]